jgi:hypothetical protein
MLEMELQQGGRIFKARQQQDGRILEVVQQQVKCWK